MSQTDRQTSHEVNISVDTGHTSSDHRQTDRQTVRQTDIQISNRQTSLFEEREEEKHFECQGEYSKLRHILRPHTYIRQSTQNQIKIIDCSNYLLNLMSCLFHSTVIQNSSWMQE